jgi:hypothetical protein
LVSFPSKYRRVVETLPNRVDIDTDVWLRFSGRTATVALKGKPFQEKTTEAVSKPGEKGWGKDMKATKDVKNKPKETPAAKEASATQASTPKASPSAASEPAAEEGEKVFLSDVTRGFKLTSKDKMYEVGRI